MRPMERGGDHGGEIGRGRQQHDSSSSRESSPAQGSKRSFSPTSDDFEAMAQEMVAENDAITTLPSERPLLRQPLGFSIDQPAQTISTYEASVSAPIISGVFLPGQEVPASSKLKKLKAKKRSSAKRPRRPEAYAGQTSRFRLQTYETTPGGDPPPNYGSGPYSSLHRGATPTTESRPALPATATTAFPQDQSSSSTASSNTMDSFGKFSSFRSSQENSSAPKSKDAVSKGKNTQPMAASPFSCSRFKQFTNENIGSTSFGGPYYRHNYESQREHATSLSPSQRQSAQTETQKKWDSIASSQRYPPAASTSSRGTDNEETEGQQRRPLRIVTLLIQDIRSGVTDHQLAEVKVPLKPSDDPQDGFWADAKDISEQLQASASRIDGPARAYTLRGKYRQFFLRVSADNADEFISANVVIQPDRTLDVVVETLQPPGALPVVPKIPKELWALRDDSEEPEDRIDVDPRREKYSASSECSRKRRTSPSFDDYDDYRDPSHDDSYSSSSKAPRHDHLMDISPRVKPSRSILDNAPPKKRRSYAKEGRLRSPENSPLPMSYPHPGSVSPGVEDSHHQPQRLDITETPREENRSTKALFV